MQAEEPLYGARKAHEEWKCAIRLTELRARQWKMIEKEKEDMLIIRGAKSVWFIVPVSMQWELSSLKASSSLSGSIYR